jgi:Protein of unknown function (DUF1320)
MPGPGGASYCTPSVLSNYIPAATLNLATSAQQLQACADATSAADGYLYGKYTMPILSWGGELTRYTAFIAIQQLMYGPIGYAPQAGSDMTIDRRYAEAVGGTIDGIRYEGWFVKIQRGALSPPDIVPSVPTGQDATHDMPQVASDPPRGWQQFRNGRPVVGGF